MRPKQALRHELKYLLRREQAGPLLDDLRARLRVDDHAAAGSYPIASLYFDTPGFKAYWDKIDGERNRRKVRVRVYGGTEVTPSTHCFLEVKQRINQMMLKRRVVLPYDQAVDFDAFPELAATHSGPVNDEGGDLLQEVYYLYRTLQLRPTCIVTYDRLALEGDELAPDLRVTLDTHLRGRTHDLSLVSGDRAANRQALSADLAVLEVKANHNVPGWLAKLLARHGCTLRRISKYCLVLETCQAIAARQHVYVAGK
jgi:hypothetical protein